MSATVSANRAIHAFEQPYRALRAAERQRHEQAVDQWEEAMRRHRASTTEVERQRTTGPLWFPVHPSSEPTRIDVIVGDPRRHGWASLLGYTPSGRLGSGDQRHERAFIGEVVRRVVGCLEGAVSFGRIAAGVDVLRRVRRGATCTRPTRPDEGCKHERRVGHRTQRPCDETGRDSQ